MNDKKHHHDHHHHHHGHQCDGNHHHHESNNERNGSTTNAYKQARERADEDDLKTESLVKESLVKLEEQLQKAQDDAKEYWEMSLRLQAELQNIQRRAEQNVEKAHKYGIEKFALALLPVVDSLEMGLQNGVAASETGKLDAILEGCELTLKMLLDTFKRFNIEPIDPVNQPFNPDFHEAMMAQETDKVPANTVINVVQKGYLLNGRVLRPARVIISKV
jgi:molecular chaperone GrpE